MYIYKARIWVEKVKTMMRYKGLNDESLAKAAGISIQTLNKLFKREGNPRYSTICKVAKALHTDPDIIIENLPPLYTVRRGRWVKTR